MLREGRSWAWPQFGNVCELVEPLMKDQPLQFILHFIHKFACWRWSKHIKVRASLIRFMISMARKCLGEDHLLTDILSML